MKFSFRQFVKNRTFVGISCIVLALILCFGIAPTVAGDTSKQVQISRVSKNIPKNTKITADMLETVRIGSYNLPDNVVRDKSDIVGQYSKTEMFPHENVISEKLSSTPLGADEYLGKLDGTKQAISVSIKSFAAGLSGKLETGDIVTLIAADYGDLKQTLTPAELQYVKVLAATSSDGVDNDSTQVKDSKNNTSSDDTPATLTLLVSPQQAKSLVEYESHGSLHAALVYRGDTATAQKFLDVQDKYLSSQGGNPNG